MAGVAVGECPLRRAVDPVPDGEVLPVLTIHLEHLVELGHHLSRIPGIYAR